MRGKSELLKFFVRPEIFVYIAFGVFSILYFILASYDGHKGEGIAGYYAKLNLPYLWGAALIFTSVLFGYGIVLWFKAITQSIPPAAVFSSKNINRAKNGLVMVAKNTLFAGAPFVLALSSMSLAIGPLNVFNSTRLKDELLFSWDVLFTGTFPPLSLASFSYPGWFVVAVDFSFFYLVPVIAIFGAYLFLFRQKLFREAAGAFFLSLLILFAGWVAFPATSPHDRFIGNVYNLPVEASPQQYVSKYSPQKEIAAFWEKVHKSREGFKFVPTTTFPSAHIVWAVFLVYYAYRLQKYLVLAALPLALLSSAGTVLFAAHYFVDIPAAVITGIFSLYVVFWIRKQQTKIQAKPGSTVYASSH